VSFFHFAFSLVNLLPSCQAQQGGKANVGEGCGAMSKVVVTEEDGERAAEKTQ
jgi:hypothetical protein